MKEEPMPIHQSSTDTLETLGQEMHRLVSELYPICRSITGEGVRETLGIIKRMIPLDVHEVSTGTAVFDWTVPREWNIRDAYIKDSQGRRIVDFGRCNLHVVSYSMPVKKRLRLDDLKPHLFTLPDRPDWIPYRTSYYNDTWGFCLTHNQLAQMLDEEYEVCIDATLAAGSLSYGECYVPGESADEALISCHICHPSLCNDNLSGIAVATYLARAMSQAPHRYSYRFLFIPGTIGSITWLARNEQQAPGIKHGLVLTCVGDGGGFTYKKTRRADAEIDRTVAHILEHSGQSYQVIDFYPYGYDERQFCSPGFNLAVGCLMRSQHGQFPEYHTSADNLDFVRPQHLAQSYATCLSVFETLEHNKTYVNRNPKCEPQLGKRGLYKTIGGHKDAGTRQMAILWVLNLSDGQHSLLDIAERSGIAFQVLKDTADALLAHELLEEHPRAGAVFSAAAH
ncbi:MAG: DUF4910 domain-containing protein [Gammaproteobacteria bacterium]